MSPTSLKECRICNSTRIIKLYPLKGGFSVYHCDNCQTDLLSPIPSAKDIRQSTDKEYFKSYEDESIKRFKISDFKRTLMEIPTLKIKSALDVGCAKGYLVEYLLNLGVDAYGIELFPQVAQEAQKKFKKERIYTGEFSKYDFKKKFDLLIMFDLVEHLEKPSEAFDKAYSILNPRGFILIVTPDITAFKRKILRRYWTAYYIEHIHCFSQRSIKYLAQNSGLSIYKKRKFYKRVNLHYFIRHLYHRFEVFQFLNFLTKISFINFTFPIDDDSMLVVLKKNG